jgi:hypothetical protein
MKTNIKKVINSHSHTKKNYSRMNNKMTGGDLKVLFTKFFGTNNTDITFEDLIIKLNTKITKRLTKKSRLQSQSFIPAITLGNGNITKLEVCLYYISIYPINNKEFYELLLSKEQNTTQNTKNNAKLLQKKHNNVLYISKLIEYLIQFINQEIEPDNFFRITKNDKSEIMSFNESEKFKILLSLVYIYQKYATLNIEILNLFEKFKNETNLSIFNKNLIDFMKKSIVTNSNDVNNKKLVEFTMFLYHYIAFIKRNLLSRSSNTLVQTSQQSISPVTTEPMHNATQLLHL